MSDIVDSAFFIIETSPLLNRVNNSTSKTASQKEFLMNRAIPFEHYSHFSHGGLMGEIVQLANTILR